MMKRFTAEWINGFQLRDVFGIGPSNICNAVSDGFIRTAEVPKSNGGMATIYNANDIRRYLNQLANHEIDYVSSNGGVARDDEATAAEVGLRGSNDFAVRVGGGKQQTNKRTNEER